MKRIIVMLAILGNLAAAVFPQKSASDSLRVTSPAGAPALALALLEEKHPDSYTRVAAETIAAEFASEKADAIIAPVNAGAKLYALGKSSYKLAAVLTWGNLYFASQKKNFTLADIAESGVTLFGENTINASIASFALEKNAVRPKSIAYLAGAAQTQSLLLTDSSAIVLTAEPALTAAKMKNPAITAYSLNDLYRKATGFEGFAQAGLFIREKTLTQQPVAVKAFLKDAAYAVSQCSENVDEVSRAAVALEILPNVKIARAAIPQCSLRFLPALEARKAIEATALVDIKQYGGALPQDSFYLAAAYYEK